MPKKNLIQLAEEFFKPDKLTGISDWKTREQINDTLLSFGNNGAMRRGAPPWDSKCKYIWDYSRLNNNDRGKILQIRTNGFSKNDPILAHPINKNIRKTLLDKYKGCIHCGNTHTLCIDHKNDMYNDKRVLSIDTQKEEDFQVLCDKCNKDLKHQINVKEKKTKKLHRVKDLNIIPFINDKFDYPWELSITVYDEHNINSKMYTYWYDPEEFHRKRDIFINITRPLNRYINRKVKLIS